MISLSMHHANHVLQGTHWGQVNPTRTALEDIGISYHGKIRGNDNGYGRMSRYQEQNPRTTFMSVFPVSRRGGLLTRTGAQRLTEDGGTVAVNLIQTNITLRGKRKDRLEIDLNI